MHITVLLHLFLAILFLYPGFVQATTIVNDISVSSDTGGNQGGSVRTGNAGVSAEIIRETDGEEPSIITVATTSPGGHAAVTISEDTVTIEASADATVEQASIEGSIREHVPAAESFRAQTQDQSDPERAPAQEKIIEEKATVIAKLSAAIRSFFDRIRSIFF
jgi:hypothetical protein